MVNVPDKQEDSQKINFNLEQKKLFQPQNWRKIERKKRKFNDK